MKLLEIKQNIEAALQSLEPSEIRVHRESADLVKVLIMSDAFKDMSLFRRVNTCVQLIHKHACLHYLFQVEPVTVEEFKERLMPWPE